MGNLNQELIEVSKKREAELFCAVKNGHLEFVKYLVSKGANVRDLGFPLYMATRYGQLNIVKYLVEDCEANVSGVKFALYMATRYGHLNIVKYLSVMIKRKEVVNISKNKNELDECCICLDKKMKNIKFESCTHQCCEDCFMKMKARNLKCHLCRRKITSHQEIHITLLK